MIAVQTDERLNFIDMTPSEFLENVANSGLNSSSIRAKVAMTVTSNQWLPLASSAIGETKLCFRQVGDRFVINMQPVIDIKDLEFYISPEGKQYSCEESYVFKNRSSTPEKQNETQKKTVENSEQTDTQKENNEIPSASSNQPSEKPREENSKRMSEDVNHPETEVDGQKITVSEPQKRAAASLDNIVRSLPNLSKLSSYGLDGIRNFVNAQRDSFRSYAEQYLQSTGLFRTDREQLKTDFEVTTALGKTNDMIDALLVFPVYTHIISKKDLLAHCSSSNLLNSIFLRICPVGMMDGKIQGYIEKITIKSSDIMSAETIVKARLKEENKSKRKLSSAEMYEYMEEALEQVYQRKKNSSSINQLDWNLDLKDYLKSFDNMIVPDIEHWNSYDVMAFDAREVKEEFLEPLLRQLQELHGSIIVTDKEAENAELTVTEEKEKNVTIDLGEEELSPKEASAGYYDDTTGEIVEETEQKSVSEFFPSRNTSHVEGSYIDTNTGKYIDEDGNVWNNRQDWEKNELYHLLSSPEYLHSEESKKRK